MAELKDLISPAPIDRCGNREFPVLSMTMHDGIMMQSERFKKSLASVDQSAYKVVKRNQLVVGFPIDEGVLYIQRAADAGIMSPAYDVWDVDQSKVDLDYLELSLHSPQAMLYYKTNLRGTTARRRSLPKGVLLALPIHLPALTEQLKIAETIKKVKAIILLHKQELQMLDDLIKARFVEMFGDPRNKKTNLVTIESTGVLSSGGTPSRTKPEFYQGRIRWFTAGELNSLYLGDTIEHISEEAIKKSPAKLFKKGTLMIGMYDTAAFKMGILTDDSSSNQACANLEPNGRYNSIWLYYIFDILKPLYLNERQGVRQKNLSLTKIRKLAFPDAPKHLQDEFAGFVNQTEKSKTAVQNALDEAQLLFDSLMQQYFG